MMSSSSSPSILNTLSKYEELRRPLNTTTAADVVVQESVVRTNIVDVVKFQDNVTLVQYDKTSTNNSAGDGTGTATTTTSTAATIIETSEVPFLHLVMIMSFSGYQPDRIPLKNGVFQAMAASLLAVEHLNTRNSTLVREINGYMTNTDCPLRFTFEALDDALSEKESVNHVINLISRTSDMPSVVLGSSRSANTIPTAIITGLSGIPQISPISTSTQLDDPTQYPLFGRTVPSDAGTTVPAIMYLRYTLGVKHLAVIHTNDSYGNGYALGLQLAAAEHAPDMVIRSYDFPFEVSSQLIEQTITLLKDTQFRYFFGIFFSTVHYKPIMTEAYRQGIAGTGEHNWMFSDSVSVSNFAGTYERGSPMHLVSKGTSRIGAVGGVPGIPFYDGFLQSMKDLDNSHDKALIQSLHPVYPDEPQYEPLQLSDDPDFFSVDSNAVVPFLYDATIAVGLAACQAYSVSENKTNFFTGEELFNAFVSLEFEGASGKNRYDNETGTRIPSTARFTLLNIVEDYDYNDNDTVRFKIVETDVFREGQWYEAFPYVFNDGRTVTPPDLPPVEIDNNYLGPFLRGTGYTFAALVICFSVGSMMWTHRHRQARVVKASQPIFLHLISAGCGFMGLAILLLSFDDEIVSDDVCTAFCIAVPWLATFGWILAFSAIFTKTHRVNKIFHNPQRFKRIKVTVWNVMKPFLILLAVAGITLLVWTLVDPPVWERSVTRIDSFSRDVETKGFCNFDDSIPYASILIVVLLGTVARSLYEAYIARNVSTEFAESEYIFLVLCIVFLVSFIGIPVMIIARDQPQARFFTAASILFVICISILAFIFVPKIAAHRTKEKSKRRHNLDLARGAAEGSVHVTGLDRPSDNSIVGDSEDEGIKVLLHPKEISRLQSQVRSLVKENKSLNQSCRQLQGIVGSSSNLTKSCDDTHKLLPQPENNAITSSTFPFIQESELEQACDLDKTVPGFMESESVDLTNGDTKT